MNTTVHEMKSRLGVGGKFVLAIMAGLIVFSVALAVVTLGLQRDSLGELLDTSKSVVEKMTDEQIQESEAATRHKAEQILQMLAEMAPGPVVEMDLTLLLSITQIATQDVDISLVEFRNAGGVVMARSGNAEGAERIERPVVMDGVKLGTVVVAYNLRRAHAQADNVQKDFAENYAAMQTTGRKALKKSGIGIFVTLLGFGAAFAFAVMALVSRMVKRPLNKVVVAADRLSKGDLTATVDYQSGDELGQLASAFNDMAIHLRRIIQEVNTGTGQLAVASEEMAAITEETNGGIQQQKEDTDLVAAAMTEMNATVQEVARTTEQAAEAARKSQEEAERGRQVVSGTLGTIEALVREVERAAAIIADLRNDSENIGMILDVIGEVADQTNLLALNAAIEAARAGEHGRGFAVVADEVRTLAQRTQQSTAEIHHVIEKLQARAQDAVKAMEEGREQTKASAEQATNALGSLQIISEAVTRIADMNVQIASAAEQQTTVVEEMNRSVVSISTVAEQNAQAMRQLENSSTSLAELATRLQDHVSRFKT